MPTESILETTRLPSRAKQDNTTEDDQPVHGKHTALQELG